MLTFGRPTKFGTSAEKKPPEVVLRCPNASAISLKAASSRAAVLRVTKAGKFSTLVVELDKKRSSEFLAPKGLLVVADPRAEDSVTFAVSDGGLVATTYPTKLSGKSRAIRFMPVVKCLDSHPVPVFDPPFDSQQDELKFCPSRFCPRGRLLGAVVNGKRSVHAVLLSSQEGWSLKNFGLKCGLSSVEYAPAGGFFCLDSTATAGAAIQLLNEGTRQPLPVATPAPDLELFGASEDGWVFLRSPKGGQNFWLNPNDPESLSALPEGVVPIAVSRSGTYALAVQQGQTLLRLTRNDTRVSVERFNSKVAVSTAGAFVVDSGAVFAVCNDGAGVYFGQLFAN